MQRPESAGAAVTTHICLQHNHVTNLGVPCHFCQKIAQLRHPTVENKVTDDLVERLKIHGRSDELNPILQNGKIPFSQREAIEVTQEVCIEAAAEIERLRERVAALEADRESLFEQVLAGDRRTERAEAESKQRLAELLAALSERDALRAVVEAMRPWFKSHYECDDAWYSCPKHTEYAGNDDRNHCDCGKDAIDAALAKLEKR